jgi:hypothetical protein
MQSGKPKKAPKVAAPSRKKPNFMRENDKQPRKMSPVGPLIKKRLAP